MTNKEMFKQAVSEGLLLRIDQDTACGENIICSDGYYRKLSETFGFEVTRPNMKRKALRRTVVAILIAAALLLAGCVAVVYREQIGNFFVNTYDTYIKGYFVSNDEEKGDNIEEYYTLTYVPEGYELVDENRIVDMAISTWEAQDGDQLIFEQALINSGLYFIDNQNSNLEIIETERYTVYIRKVNGNYCCFWSDSNYAFTLFLVHETSMQEIEMIVKGATVNEK